MTYKIKSGPIDEFAAAETLLRRVRDELLECHLQLKDVTEDNGDLLISGYASTGDVDRMDDIIDPQAFQRTFDYFMANGTILAHHEPSWPVGLPEDADIRQKGLWLKSRIKGGFDPRTPEGRAYHGVKVGVLRGYSVGFRILASENEDGAQKAGYKIERVKRRITDLDLYETSVVTIPANRKTMFKLDKSVAWGTDNPEKMYAEHRLRAALDLFEDTEEKDSGEIARAASLLVLRAAAGGIASRSVTPGAHYLRGSVGE